jgi:hypothetical protein
MTKKDLTALLIAFLGAWLMLEAVLNLCSVISVCMSFEREPSFRDSSGSLATAVVGLLAVLIYGGLAIFIIRKSGLLAEALLYFAKIGADEKIEGLSFTSFLPIGISLLGLYFIVTYFPSFVVTFIKWFALEANSTGALNMERAEQSISKYKQSLLYEGCVLATAFFVFLRADMLAKLAGKYRKTSMRLPESAPTPIESPAPQEPHQP